MRMPIEKLYKKAKRHACIVGFGSLSDDFASWYIVKILENKRQSQLIQFAFIDFLRHSRGNEDRSPENARFIERSNKMGCFDEETMEAKNKQDDVLDVMVKKQTIRNLLESLKDSDREVMVLYFFDEITMKEIARVKGVTESRMSQRISRIIRNAKLRFGLED